MHLAEHLILCFIQFSAAQFNSHFVLRQHLSQVIITSEVVEFAAPPNVSLMKWKFWMRMDARNLCFVTFDKEVFFKKITSAKVLKCVKWEDRKCGLNYFFALFWQ